MAEEKKLADELLSDDELDAVAGGSLSQSADDSHFLNDILYGKPGQCDQYGKTRIYFDDDATENVTKAWKSLGIECEHRTISSNRYSYGGQKISRRRAYKIAWVNAGRNINDLPPGWGD